MRPIFCTTLALAILICPAQASTHCDQSPVLITNVKIWNAEEPDADSILIADGHIRWIGAAVDAPTENLRVRKVNGAGAAALPGLIDSHTHFDALPAAKHLQPSLDVETEIYPVTMRQTLASGVTTARTHLSALADMAFLKSIADDDCFPAPRIALSGPGLLAGAPSVNGRLMRGYADAADLADKIDELVERGAEWIALHRPSRLSDADKEAIREAAARHSVKFLADADSFEDFEAALDLPVASAEYINRTEADVYPDDILKAIGSRREAIFVTPPIGYYSRSAVYAADDDKKIDDFLFLFAPEALRNAMRESFNEAFENDDYIASAVASLPMMPAKFHQLRQAGAKLIVGSDSGSLGQFHHDAIWAELAAWREFSVATADIVAAASSIPAEMLDRADIGRIAVGARGDVVLYTGDVDDGVFMRSGVSSVIKGGVIYVDGGEWRGPDADEMSELITVHKARLNADQ